MASSFGEQIPIILYLFQQLRPRCVLDIGKGFGKYGFLLHEYTGIDHQRRAKRDVTLAAQSRTAVDCIDVNTDYRFPHLDQIYRKLMWGRIEQLYRDLDGYDIVLMIDVVEHMEKAEAMSVIDHFAERGSTLIIGSPKTFFKQSLFESEHEDHISHWTPRDFKDRHHVQFQSTRNARIYVVSKQPVSIYGFGNSLTQKAKRIAWAVLCEIT